MNRKTPTLPGKKMGLTLTQLVLFYLCVDNEENSPMIAQLASLQRLKEVRMRVRSNTTNWPSTCVSSRWVGTGGRWVGSMLSDCWKINKTIRLSFGTAVIGIIFSQSPLNHKAIFIILASNTATVRSPTMFLSIRLEAFALLDSFSFYHGTSKSQCTSPDVVEFIENTIEHSKSGQFMFFIRSNIPGRSRATLEYW